VVEQKAAGQPDRRQSRWHKKQNGQMGRFAFSR
jgi:hypothetical protein